MTTQCDVCDEVLSNNVALRRHRWSRHTVTAFPPFVVRGKEYVVTPQDKKYCCPLDGCGHKYTNKEGLRRHLRDAHDVVPDTSSPSPPGVEDGLGKEQLHGKTVRGFESTAVSRWPYITPLTNLSRKQSCGNVCADV